MVQGLLDIAAAAILFFLLFFDEILNCEQLIDIVGQVLVQ